MMDTNFNLYYIFYTVAKCGNLSAAAKQLFISQPAVSKSIAKLEENLNVQLLERSSRGVTLTYEGDLLYQHLGPAFASIQTAQNKLESLKNEAPGSISIGVSSTLCKYILLPKLKEYNEKYHQTKVNIICQPTAQTIQDIHDGSIDIGIIGQPENTEGLILQSIFEMHDIFVTAPSYMDRMNISDQDTSFHDLTLLLLDRGNYTRRYVDKYIDTSDFGNINVIEVNTMDLLIEMAKSGLGVGCVIREFVDKEISQRQLITMKKFPVIPMRHCMVAYSDKKEPTQAMQRMLAFFAE